ncbi:MAG: GAF domain-containing protein [Candidatus Poribacteria bacterium]|nr:GAF domain-containing protein [Candidatus Poribacteria bacterium]
MGIDLLTADDLRTLIEITHRVNSTLEVRKAVDETLHRVTELVEADASSIWLLDDDTNEVVCANATGERANEVLKVRLAFGHGIAGRVVEHGKIYATGDAINDKYHAREVAIRVCYDVHEMLCVPLNGRGTTIGCVQVMNKVGGRMFSDRDVQLVSAFADLAALAVHNAALFTRQQEDHEAIRRSEQESRKFRHIVEQSPSTVAVLDTMVRSSTSTRRLWRLQDLTRRTFAASRTRN